MKIERDGYSYRLLGTHSVPVMYFHLRMSLRLAVSVLAIFKIHYAE